MNIKNETINYFKQWASDDTTKSKHLFIEMLQSKCFFAKSKKIKVRAGGRQRTGSEIDKMLCYADNNF